MSIIAYNILWMTWNIMLAAVAVAAGWFLTRRLQPAHFFLLAFVWLIFVPNTIYMVTDLYHLAQQWGTVGNIEKIILMLQYTALTAVAVITFVVSVYFFEYSLTRFYARALSATVLALFIVFINFVIAFGVVVGRVQRTNSWEVFTNPVRVYNDIVQTLSSPILLVLVLVLGTFANVMYFSFRDIYKKPFYSLKKHLAYFHV